jgi:hypothetical protein
MARKANVNVEQGFADEEAMPSSRAGRPSNIPESLLAALRMRTPKSYVLETEEEAKAFRALVRRAASREEMGSRSAVEQLSDGRWKVFFQGTEKRPYGNDADE